MSNGKWYVGSTRDREERIARHMRGGVNSTKKYLPVVLKYYREYATYEEAYAQERYLKKSKSRKIIESFIQGF